MITYINPPSWTLSPTVYAWVRDNSMHPGIQAHDARGLTHAALMQGNVRAAYEITREAAYNNGHARAINFVFGDEKQLCEKLGFDPVIRKSNKFSLKVTPELETALVEVGNDQTECNTESHKILARLLRRVIWRPYNTFALCYAHTNRKCELVAFVWALQIDERYLNV